MLTLKDWLPRWMHPVPPWAWLLIAVGLLVLARMVWLEIGVRARQIRVLRNERAREMREFLEWNARWQERHADEADDSRRS